MTLARKLELACGGVIGLLAVAILVTGIQEAYAVSVHLDKSLDLSEILIGFTLVIFCPCLLISYGSFLHAVKQRDVGNVLLVTGCTFIIGYFLLSIFTIAFIAVLKSPFIILLWFMAIVILIVANVVDRQNKEANASA